MAGAQCTPDSPRCRRPGSGLVYHAGGLGDFVLSLPAIRRVVRSAPPLEWGYWGPSERLLLLPGFSGAPPELLREGQSLWGSSPATAALERLRSCRVVLAFGGAEPPPWVRGVPRGLGVSAFPAGSGACDPIPRHQRDQLDRLGIPRLAERWLPEWRRAVLPAASPRWIVLQPGSGDPKKNPPARLWRDCLAELRRRTDAPVVLLVGPAEEERGGWEELRTEVKEVRLSRTLGDLLQTLSEGLIYLGNDSGASHLSGALGVPTVVFFGPSDARLWKPLGPRVETVRARLGCSPCTVRGPITCDGRECLTSVSGRELARAALGLLEGP